jgi:cytoskeleton protein RodZ
MVSAGVGERLRSARTARGLSLDDIAAATRIRRQYLDALEREAWGELPGATYVRGFLGTYAKQLGLSPDEIVGMYPASGGTQAAAAGIPRPVEVRITPAQPHSRLRNIITAIVVVFIAGAAVLAYVLVGQLRQFAATRPHPVTSAPTTAAPAPAGPPAVAPNATAPAVTPTAGLVTPTAGVVTPTAGGQPASSAPTPVTGQAIVLTAQASDRSWVRVVSDGAVVFEGFLSAGDHEVWQGHHQVSIRVGNASALDLSVNGQSLGHLGNPGDVVDRTFSIPSPSTIPAPPAAPPAAPAAPSAPSTVPAKPAPPAAAPPAAPGGPTTPTNPHQ